MLCYVIPVYALSTGMCRHSDPFFRFASINAHCTMYDVQVLFPSLRGYGVTIDSTNTPYRLKGATGLRGSTVTILSHTRICTQNALCNEDPRSIAHHLS